MAISMYASRDCGLAYALPLCTLGGIRAGNRIAGRQCHAGCSMQGALRSFDKMWPGSTGLRLRLNAMSRDKWAAAEENALLLRNSDRQQAATSQQPGTDIGSDDKEDSSDEARYVLDKMEKHWTKYGVVAETLDALEAAGIPSASARCNIEYMLRTCYTNERAQASTLQLQALLDISEAEAWMKLSFNIDLLLFPPHSLPSRCRRLAVLAAAPSEALRAIKLNPKLLTYSSKQISDRLGQLAGLGYTKDEQLLLLCASVWSKDPSYDDLKEAHAELAHIFEGSHDEVRAFVVRLPHFLEMVTDDAEAVAARAKLWSKENSLPIETVLKDYNLRFRYRLIDYFYP